MSISLNEFRDSLPRHDVISALHDDVIGHDVVIDGPFGPRRMIYADHVASGRALGRIERFVLERLLPLYANSHTEASHVGATMTRLRREARAVIAESCGAGPEHAVVFCGAGATQGINRLVHLFGVRTARDPLVILGPYEHHSNILPWRESGAEIVTLPEDPAGGPCRAGLARALEAGAGRLTVVALSAASNVTGTLSDVAAITAMVKAAGALMVWDYAGGGPYLPIAMRPAEGADIDAIVLSTHKFVGGPQASGVMVIRRDRVRARVPTLPGGGTVRFVSPEGHDYAGAVERREEAGTPNVIGDLRAALCFMVKDHVGTDEITRRGAAALSRARAAFAREARIELLGRFDIARLPILSFRLRDGQGGYLHLQLVTRILSDLHGVQARGGCACAGPYVHDLLGIGPEESHRLRQAILLGQELEKPGFVRLNLSYLCPEDEISAITGAVVDVARRGPDLAAQYRGDPATAIYRPRDLAG